MKLTRLVAILAVLFAVFVSGVWMLLDLGDPGNNAGRQVTEPSNNGAPQTGSQEPANPTSEVVATKVEERLDAGALTDETQDLAARLADALMGGEQDTLPTDLLINQLRDEGLPLLDRRKAAWGLAQDGSPEALAALKQALAKGSPYLRATIAEALGHFQHPQAMEILAELLEDGDDVVARGAVRGLAASGDPDAIDLLSAVLGDDSMSESVRAEAAVGLAELDDWESSEVLLDAFDLVRSQDNDLWEGILEGLGTRPFSEVGDFYMDLVESSNDPEVRVLAIESLSETTSEAVPFLLRVAEDDTDPEARAAAVWALGSFESQADVGQDLMDLLQTEDEPEVRRNIYGALGSQADASLKQVMKSAMGEFYPDVRLQAFGSAARLLSMSPTASQARRFDSEMVPELLDIALTDTQFHRQINAFNALRVANTDGAQIAVRTVADANHPMLGEAAQQASGEP